MGRRLPMTPFRVGFALGAAISFFYCLVGPWGRIPLHNMSVPAHAWARLLFWPGLVVGRWVFRQTHATWGLDGAKYFSALAGVLTVGLAWGAVLALVARLRVQ